MCQTHSQLNSLKAVGMEKVSLEAVMNAMMIGIFCKFAKINVNVSRVRARTCVCVCFRHVAFKMTVSAQCGSN